MLRTCAFYARRELSIMHRCQSSMPEYNIVHLLSFKPRACHLIISDEFLNLPIFISPFSTIRMQFINEAIESCAELYFIFLCFYAAIFLVSFSSTLPYLVFIVIARKCMLCKLWFGTKTQVLF